METLKKNHDIIDIIKFVASICILLLHSNIFFSVNENLQFYGVQLLSRWGVPFFFTISAYFLFSHGNKGSITNEQLFNYIKRLLILYLAWFVLNIPYIAYKLYLQDITNPKTWLSFLLNAVISSTFLGSWYLTCSIFSAFFVFFLAKKLQTKYIFIIALGLYVFCVIANTYSKVFSINFNYGFCNSILAGVIFYVLGKIIAENKEKLLKTNKWKLLVLFLTFFAIYYLEMVFLKINNLSSSTDASIFLIPFAFFFVLFLLKINIKIKAARYFRKASTIIYCSQGMVLLASSFIAKIFMHTEHTILKFLISVIICAFVVLIILHIDRKNKIKIIKNLM